MHEYLITYTDRGGQARVVVHAYHIGDALTDALATFKSAYGSEFEVISIVRQS